MWAYSGLGRLFNSAAVSLRRELYSSFGLGPLGAGDGVGADWGAAG